jgi:hypothetical protein
MHLARWGKHGDPSVVGERLGRPLKGDKPSYAAVHKRLERAGRASERACVDCGGNASSWSYVGGCPNELREVVRGIDLAYSEDTNRYEPRCTSCHRKFDGAGNRARNEKGQFVPDDVEAVAA